MTSSPEKRPLSKTDIVNRLATRFGLGNYLEICTPSTGNQFSLIERHVFTTTRRLMYLSPLSFQDGMSIDFRSPDEDISDAVAAVQASDIKVDICLVDGWHRYSTAIRDLREANAILTEGGVLVVHDCLPPRRDVASPKFRKGEWCGVQL